MKPAPFIYLRPDSVEEAVSALHEHGEAARVLAGGQSLMAMLNLRLAGPKVLIDISSLEELSSIRLDGGMIEIGAAVTQATLEAWPQLREKAPFLAAVLPWVGHFQTRNRGTVCGSIAHADPSSELPLALALLDGEVVLRSRSGERRVKAGEFQTGILQTSRRDDELITAVRVAAGVGKRGVAFREVSRRHGDFAIVSVGIVVPDADTLQIGIGGVADRPRCIRIDAKMPEDALSQRIERLAWELDANDDIHASAWFRRDLVRRLTPALISEVRACGA